jgi:hypothetical protein
MAGTTHGCVLERFAVSFSRDFFLSQEIDLTSPLVWLMNRREEVNYRFSRFTEPMTPRYFKFAVAEDLRKLLTTYTSNDVYVFDPDHAMVAFPFRLMLDVRSRLFSRGIDPLRKEESDFLSQFGADHAGMITALKPLIF